MVTTAAIVALTAVATGCDVDANFSSPIVVDRISIAPEQWKVMLNGGQLDFFYCDVELREINESVFRTGSFQTFWKYGELHNGGAVEVQEPLPAIRNQPGYSETISCNYEVGSVRIMIRRHPSTFDSPPDRTLYFRTVIGW